MDIEPGSCMSDNMEQGFVLYHICRTADIWQGPICRSCMLSKTSKTGQEASANFTCFCLSQTKSNGKHSVGVISHCNAFDTIAICVQRNKMFLADLCSQVMSQTPRQQCMHHVVSRILKSAGCVLPQGSISLSRTYQPDQPALGKTKHQTLHAICAVSSKYLAKMAVFHFRI